MTDKTEPRSIDRPHAPVIFFTAVPALSIGNGIVSLTLSAEAHLHNGESVDTQHLVMAYLRTSLAGAAYLRDMLNKAFAMAATPDSTVRN